MSVLSKFWESMSGNAGHKSPGYEPGRIERLCRELGWAVDAKDAKGIWLYFVDPQAGVRKLRITCCDRTMVGMKVLSNAVLPGHTVAPPVIGYLLRRNEEVTVGAWSVRIDDEDKVSFALNYEALGDGLDAVAFKVICEQLIKEALAFDDKMRQAGFLR